MNENESMKRTWHWQIDEIEEGPDYVFLASCASADAERLHAFVHKHLPDAYVENPSQRPKHRADAKLYSSYLDRSTQRRLHEMDQTGSRESIWHHGEIEVFDQHVSIKHMSAGGMFDDTDLVLRLAEARSLTMLSWIVGYSGYEWAEVARGASGFELATYIRDQRHLTAAPFHPAPQPAAGVDVDERRTVSLLQTRPSDGIEFDVSEYMLTISRALLESIAAGAPTTWKSERERLALIAGSRAKKLLLAADARSSMPVDTNHLLLQLFERGAVHVVRRPAGQRVPRVSIHYSGRRSAPMVGRGFITMSDGATGVPFVHIDWWVS